MTDITSKLAAFAAATGGDQLYDPEWKGGEWMVEAVETHETLEQFEESSAKWAERSAIQRGEIAGLPYLCWSKVQTRKGAPRRSLWVIDFGDVRIAIDADARFYC